MALRMSHDEYMRRVKEKHGDRYDLSRLKYINNRTKITVGCRKHGWFEAFPQSFIKGSGCRKCADENRKVKKRYTKESFIEKANIRHNNKYDYSKVNYVDQNTPVTIICPEHGEFTMKPVAHVNGSGCRKCKSEYSYIKTEDEFKEYSKKLYGDKYDLSGVRFKNLSTPVKIRCKEHNIVFTQIPKYFFKGPACPECSKNKRMKSTDEFIKEAREVHGDKYDYSITEYTGSDKKIKYICPIHGVIEQKAVSHLKHGCEKCGFDKKKMSQEEFLRRAREIHGDRYDYSKTKLERLDKKVTITCKEHGDFEKYPYDHIRPNMEERKNGHGGCPICYASRGEQEIWKFLHDHNIRYIKEYKIPGHNFAYDYYLPDLNVFIEHYGKQHFIPVKHWGGEEGLAKRKKNDEIKEMLVFKMDGNLIKTYYNQEGNLAKILDNSLKRIFSYKRDGKYFRTFLDFAKYYNLPMSATIREYKQYRYK